MSGRSTAPLAVVIATRNRGAQIEDTIRSILCSNLRNFELRIIDQSDDSRTEECVKRYASDMRLHYIRSCSRGLSAGRNIGISNSGCELIALTDDDCEVQSDWPEELVSAFAPDQRIGVVLGNVLPGPHDRLRGFIPSYIRSEPFMARSIREKPEVEGIGACMGLRRSCWHDLGGFDPLLGAGARFRAGEEVDLIIRALTAGYFVYETPRLAVTHLGFRSWRESRELIGGHLYGLGAAFAKQVRCRHRGVIPILAKLAERWAFKQPAVYYGLRRQRRLRLVSFLRGFWAGLLTPVDRTRGHFGCGN